MVEQDQVKVMDAGNLTGNYRVRVFRPAWGDVDRLFRRTRDRIELRSHALKLRYWPEKYPTDQVGKVLDLDWSWIEAAKGLNIGELRIDDTIDGRDNLRIIFYVGDSEVRVPLPVVWVLQVLQKKRNDFTTHNITTFKARRTLVNERFYKDREFQLGC